MSSQSRFSDGRLGAPPPQKMWVPQGVTPGVRTLNEGTVSLKRVESPPADDGPAVSRPEPKVPNMVRTAPPVAEDAAEVNPAQAQAAVAAEHAPRARATTRADAAASEFGDEGAAAPFAVNSAAEIIEAAPPATEWVEPEWAEAPAAEVPAPDRLSAPGAGPAASAGLVADLRRRMQANPPVVAEPPAPPASRFRAMLSKRAAPAQAPEALAPENMAPAAEAWPAEAYPYADAPAEAYAQQAAAYPAGYPAETANQMQGQYAPMDGAVGQQGYYYPPGYDPSQDPNAGGAWPQYAAEGEDGAADPAAMIPPPPAPRTSYLPFAALGLVGVLAIAGSAYLGGWLTHETPVTRQTVAAAPVVKAPVVKAMPAAPDAPVQAAPRKAKVAKAPPAQVEEGPAAMAIPAAPMAEPGSRPAGPAEAPAPADEPVTEASAGDKPFMALIECPGMTEAKEIRVEGPDAAAVRAGIGVSLPGCRIDRVTEAGATDARPDAG